jgi:hypothetical protein
VGVRNYISLSSKLKKVMAQQQEEIAQEVFEGEGLRL